MIAMLELDVVFVKWTEQIDEGGAEQQERQGSRGDAHARDRQATSPQAGPDQGAQGRSVDIKAELRMRVGQEEEIFDAQIHCLSLAIRRLQPRMEPGRNARYFA